MKNILFKGSGDITDSKKFFDDVVASAKNNYVVVICGGGTKISVALKAAGFEIKFDDLGRRITETWDERMIMRHVLEVEEKRQQDKFVGKGVNVKAPILHAGSVLCPINGDDLVKAWDLGFDEIYVYTKPEREKKKKEIFKDFPKVDIISVSTN